MFRSLLRLSPWLAAWLATSSLHAQWVTQSIRLQPGWNAVYLEVQPQPDACDTVFANLPIESVWAWNRRFSTVQFVQDVNSLVPGQPDWLVYQPPASPGRAVQNLFAIQGGRPYLIKLRSTASPVTWVVTGQPAHRTTDWLPNTLNFVGFPLAEGAAPSFQDFFAGAPAHRGQAAYRLTPAGLWEPILKPATARLQPGAAYWIQSQGPSRFSGPLEVLTDQRDGLVYGRLLTELSLRIRNASATPATIRLRTVESQAPPLATSPLRAGAPPLSYFRSAAPPAPFGWTQLPPELTQVALPPGGEWHLRLEINRTRMAGFTPPTLHPGALYQGVLEVLDALGARTRIGVSAEGLVPYPATTTTAAATRHAPRPAAGAGESHPHTGLWVGSASIHKVNQPSAITAPNTPLPTASSFQFRLILHVDNAGKVHLLQQVLQMFRPGTTRPDPANPAATLVDEPGRPVLVTDDALIPRFTGATLRDGQSVARRISAPAFGFARPVPLAGAGEFGTGKFTGPVGIDFDDRLNPFKHRYHPDHDNLDARFERRIAAGVESFPIGRQLELEFRAQDPEGLGVAGWGDNQLGGVYRETVTGLHHRPIHLEGTFRLTQASRIGVLNDGL